MSWITGNENVSPKITGNITYGIGSGDTSTIYDGNYDVTPSASAQTVLHTKNKRLTDNVVVKKIPYFETTNAGGGSTVYIAGEVKFG